MILTIATRSNGQFRHRVIDDRIPKNHLLRRINASSTTRFHTIRPFLRTGCIGSGKAMSFATYSRGENHPMPAA